MSHLVAKLMLAMLMVPLAGVLYLLVFVLLAESIGWNADELLFVLSGVVVWAFIGLYWWWLWRGAVKWTGTRVSQTMMAVLGAGLVATVVGLMITVADDEVGAFCGSALGPLLWVGATVLIWRDTPDERANRLGATESVVCLTCGYNLTGLTEARCPECGRQYTLNELFAGQPTRPAKDFEPAT